MSGIELKPCPFCGGESGECPDQNHSTGWDVGCFNADCDIEPHVWAVHRETARDQWNSRTPDPEQIRADALREEFQFPDDVIYLVKLIGRAEWGATEPKTAEDHGADMVHMRKIRLHILAK